MTYWKALKDIFLLLDGRDLASCMCVSKQWRDVARDDYIWKALCTKYWPSSCKRPTPSTVSYHKLFQMFSNGHTGFKSRFHSPKLSFDDLEFYIDIWVSDSMDAEPRVIFSEVIPGSLLRGGPKKLPPEIYGRLLSNHLKDADEYKMIIPLEPKFSCSIPCVEMDFASVSVFVSRVDTNKVACIVDRSFLYWISDTVCWGFANKHLDFASPFYPFRLPVRPPYSLLTIADLGREEYDVFAIQLDFFLVEEGRLIREDDGFESVANSEKEVLWLLGMLDWD